ncbi:SDR family NAD(P)-dependent oxidoreductase [Deinococcus deserti]|uniref:Putative oxidoreductase n=1 Tax=Deinococcus deserti (strain DSM 17065 / CIP 109153 / LMG 22923 / VCD115) TaxID=546414 RepID=C1CZF4_DEIDV|nr:SDR family NAD(P)-dependent oxidoreductase [Deinococcus deserti]ACO47202.1 putative oxidoreductase [Deinococcus deserti VCD115]
MTLTLAARALQRAHARGALRDRVVVITGASSGIGRAVALESAARGARVVLAARNVEALERVAQEARELGGEVLVMPADVRERPQVERLVEAAVNHFGQIDVMFNNAGQWFIDSVEHSDEGRTRDLIDLNMMGVLYGVQAAVPVMRRQGFGHIINTSSVEGRISFPFTGVYAGTKAFIEGMTQSLRQELMHVEKTGIKVSVLLPVTTRTAIFDNVANIKAGGFGAHMNEPVQEAAYVARGVVDAMEVYRPVILPFTPIKSLILFYDLFPDWANRLLTLVRVDEPASVLSHAQRGSHPEKSPHTPVVRSGEAGS